MTTVGFVRVPELEGSFGSCRGCFFRDTLDVGACLHPRQPVRECIDTKSIFAKVPVTCKMSAHKAEYRARSNDPATSKGKRKVNKYEQAVIALLDCEPHGPQNAGLTGKEMALYTGHPLNCITPRFSPLRRKGLIKDSGVRRDKQIVWVLV